MLDSVCLFIVLGARVLFLGESLVPHFSFLLGWNARSAVFISLMFCTSCG